MTGGGTATAGEADQQAAAQHSAGGFPTQGYAALLGGGHRAGGTGRSTDTFGYFSCSDLAKYARRW